MLQCIIAGLEPRRPTLTWGAIWRWLGKLPNETKARAPTDTHTKYLWKGISHTGVSTKFHCAQRLSTSKIKILFIEQRPSILGLVFRFCSIMLAHAKQIVNAYFNNQGTPQMIINQGLQEGLISSAPRSVTQPHQYISLSSPLQYIYQYINTKEEAIHDVASFLCTRSAIACNNQIRCYTFFWARGGQKQMTACYHDCMIVFEFCYISA